MRRKWSRCASCSDLRPCCTGRARTRFLPRFSVSAKDGLAPGDEVHLAFPRKWLAEHPLTKLDLEQEAEYLSAIPLRLTVSAR